MFKVLYVFYATFILRKDIAIRIEYLGRMNNVMINITHTLCFIDDEGNEIVRGFSIEVSYRVNGPFIQIE